MELNADVMLQYLLSYIEKSNIKHINNIFQDVCLLVQRPIFDSVNHFSANVLPCICTLKADIPGSLNNQAKHFKVTFHI